MESLTSYTFTVACAAVITGLAKGLMPTGKTEKQTRLVTALFLLAAIFSGLEGVNMSALTTWVPTTNGVSYEGLTDIMSDGTLSVTRSLLAANIEEVLGDGFDVVGIELDVVEENVSVKTVEFFSLNGRGAEDISLVLDSELGIDTVVREVG